jgi:hypothetical protein
MAGETFSGLNAWSGPLVSDMVGKAAALSNVPYQAYSGPLAAGASPLQNQAFSGLAGLAVPDSVMQAGSNINNVANQMQGMSYAPQGATNQFTATDPYQRQEVANQFAATAPYATQAVTNQFTATDPYQNQTFANQAFNTDTISQYMNPYLQGALQPQIDEARRQAEITRMQDASRLTSAGAYGGSRQAIMESELNRNLLSNLSNITGQGYNTAYNNALSQFNTMNEAERAAAQMNMTDRQFASNQALQNAQNLAQYGQAAQSMNQADRQFGATYGLQNAQNLAQYGQAAAQMNQADRQFGSTQALQNAQNLAQYGQAAQSMNQADRQFGSTFGLNALQSAGGMYGQAAAQGLAGLEAQKGVTAAQLAGGAQDRAIRQSQYDAALAQYEQERLQPYEQINFLSSILAGLPPQALLANETPNWTTFTALPTASQAGMKAGGIVSLTENYR